MSARAAFSHAIRVHVVAAALVFALPTFAQSPSRAIPDFAPLVQRYGGAVVNVVATRLEQEQPDQDPNAAASGEDPQIPPELRVVLTSLWRPGAGSPARGARGKAPASS